MKNAPMNRSYAPTALMLGNIVTGTSILAPAGMLNELAAGFGVTVRVAGLLVTFGALVLCIASPVTAWLTGRIERRRLLSVTLAVFAITNIASAFAPDFVTLMLIRLVMLAIGALYTPQAAGVAATIVPAERRGSAIAYVFLGWSIAAAVGLPLITYAASRYGIRAAYSGIGAIACVSWLSLVWRLPRGLRGVPVDMKTWVEIGRNPLIGLLLLITTLQMSGQFVVFTFIGPLLRRLTDAGPDAISLVFALYGVFGFIGIVVATQIVDSWGTYKTSLIFTAFLMAGVTGWALSAGSYPLMAASVAIWGLGFASTNSMQQARLVAAAPPLASASVALNTSVLYIGQAIGSAVGGVFYARDLLYGAGYVAMGFVALALLTVMQSSRVPNKQWGRIK